MNIRQVDTSAADRLSARVFFDALATLWDLSEVEALDAFARNGQLTVASYRHAVKSVDCWELMEEHEYRLKALNPRKIVIGCSYEQAALSNQKYGLIVVDTPQGLHKSKDSRLRIEHFDFLKFVPRLVGDSTLLVLYVNKTPYDKEKAGNHGYDDYESYNYTAWMHKRSSFYNSPTGFINEEQALTAYRKEFAELGFVVVRTLVIPCFSDVPDLEPYAFRVCLEVKRVT